MRARARVCARARCRPTLSQVEQLAKARASDVVVAVGQTLEKEDGCNETVRQSRDMHVMRACVRELMCPFPCTQQDIELLMSQLALNRDVNTPPMLS